MTRPFDYPSTMHADHQATVAFHLTGKRVDGELAALEAIGLRPALLAAYRDLRTLRYDFPLVLAGDERDESLVESLSRLIDRALEKAARKGPDAERIQAHALKLEAQVRALAAAGTAGSLAELLDEAARRLGPQEAAVAESVRRLRAALPAHAEVLDCDAGTPRRLLTHVWKALQHRKVVEFHRQVDRLILKLSDILQADRSRSEEARSPTGLKASVGANHGEVFDFEAMSRILAKVACDSTLTESRRRRIETTLQTLESQRFCAPPDDPGALEFRFDDCASALEAFRQRVPEMVKLARAITIAKLEIEGEYSEPRHDALFERLAAGGLDARDMALFPDYLVCVNARDLRSARNADLMEILASGLPVKLLVQSDDILEPPLMAGGQHVFGARSRQLATIAMGLNEVYVLQTASSNLLNCSDSILKAMNRHGPALFSIFSGAAGASQDLPPYLVAAAAMESRAFPAFTYDPDAGTNWASRVSLEGNPQAERDWPLHPLRYEDSGHQRVAEEVAFTLLDFVACDRRYAAHFAGVPQADWTSTLLHAADCVDQHSQGLPDRLPSLLMVDSQNRLHKVVVDERLIGEARRCREMWHGLQELARANVPAASAPAAEAPPAESPASAASPAAAPAEPAERSSDEPYIETPRCSSCDECIQINGKMFAYDANKQARIVDPLAGTYRQLVEAAESCQVAVIHPGKPKNPNEPGLDELLKRAEPFIS